VSLAVGSVLGIAVVAALPSGGSSAMGDTCVLAGDGHLYTYNGAAWVDNGAAGGGGGGTQNVFIQPSASPVPSLAFAPYLLIQVDGDDVQFLIEDGL
jgi:hypothetical protein